MIPNLFKEFPYVNGGLFKKDYKIPNLLKNLEKYY